MCFNIEPIPRLGIERIPIIGRIIYNRRKKIPKFNLSNFHMPIIENINVISIDEIVCSQPMMTETSNIDIKYKFIRTIWYKRLFNKIKNFILKIW